MPTIYRKAINQILGNDVMASGFPIGHLPNEFRDYGTDELVGLRCDFNNTLFRMLYVGSSIAECVDTALQLGLYTDYQTAFFDYGNSVIGFNTLTHLYDSTQACEKQFVINELLEFAGNPFADPYDHWLHVACEGYPSIVLHTYYNGAGDYTWEIFRSYLVDNVFNPPELSPAVDPNVFVLTMLEYSATPVDPTNSPTVLNILSIKGYDEEILSEDICDYEANTAKLCNCESNALQACRYIGALAYKAFDLFVLYFDPYFAAVPLSPAYQLLGSFPDTYISNPDQAILYWQTVIMPNVVNLPFTDATNSLCRCAKDYRIHVKNKQVINQTYGFVDLLQVSFLPINKALKPYILCLAGCQEANGAPPLYSKIQELAIFDGTYHGLTDDYGTPFDNTAGYNMAGYGFFIEPLVTSDIQGYPIISYAVSDVDISVNYPSQPFPKSNINLLYQGKPDAGAYNAGAPVIFGNKLGIDFTECCQDPTASFESYLEWNICDADVPEFADCVCCTQPYELLVGDVVSLFIPTDKLTPAGYDKFIKNKLSVYVVADSISCTPTLMTLQPSADLHAISEVQGFFTIQMHPDLVRGRYRFAIFDPADLLTPLLLSDAFEYISEPTTQRGLCRQYKYTRKVRFRSSRNSLGYLYADMRNTLADVYTDAHLWQSIRLPIDLIDVQTSSTRTVAQLSNGRQRISSANVAEIWTVNSEWLDYSKLLLIEKIFAHEEVQIQNNLTGVWEDYILDSRQDMKYPERWCNAQLALKVRKNTCIANNYVC